MKIKSNSLKKNFPQFLNSQIKKDFNDRNTLNTPKYINNIINQKCRSLNSPSLKISSNNELQSNI